jgi:hypothetical protein
MAYPSTLEYFTVAKPWQGDATKKLKRGKKHIVDDTHASLLSVMVPYLSLKRSGKMGIINTSKYLQSSQDTFGFQIGKRAHKI